MATLDQRLRESLSRVRRFFAPSLLTLSMLGGIGATAHAQNYPPPENVISLNTGSSESEPELSCNGDTIYFAANGIMQATRNGSAFTNITPVLGLETITDPIGTPTLSCDELEIIYMSWPQGSNPATSAALYLGTRPNAGSPFTVRMITELDVIGNYEGNASFFDNDLRIAFIRSCDPIPGPCDLASRGIYEAARADRSSPFAPVRKWDEFDVLNNGNLGDVGVSRDGLKALISCYNCAGGSGDGDILYADRPDLTSRFSNFQFLTLNTAALEASASFALDPSTIYFGSTRGGGQGASDIWRSVGCPIPPEVSSSASSNPLRVEYADPSITLSFEDLNLSTCNGKYNVYIGALIGFANITDTYCHVAGIPGPSPGTLTFTMPRGGRSEFYLVTASTSESEGSAGFDSSGNPRSPIFNLCGPSP